ncbi:MAG: KAP family NTPase [Mediterranea sp.]|jgi:GTPase SAR1 family protein|nr:KAP family NTPase [Mediterranea sp.]
MRLGYENVKLPWTIALTLLIPVWIGLAPEWYLWYGGKENGLWMKWLYDLLDDRWLVNIPICVILGYFVYRWYLRIREDNDIRLFRPLLTGIGLFFLYWDSQVVYAKVVWCIDYRILLTILLLPPLLMMLIKGIRKANSRKETKQGDSKGSGNHGSKGFSTDDIGSEDIPESLKSYISLIAKKLTATNINEQSSYAVGITGEWGVGKTTFLKSLKKEIEDKAEVIEFNPWMCRTPEQVTQDFFASLRHQLSSKHSTLSKSIREYAKYVNNLTLTPHTTFNLDMMLPVRGESLYERKRSLSEKFSYLPRPVVVIIDDIDRLEREEVFEVLRLIRNTADLSNTIYIVAYDKEYVTCVLEEKKHQGCVVVSGEDFPHRSTSAQGGGLSYLGYAIF